MVKQHHHDVTGLESLPDLIPVFWEGALVLGIQIGLDVLSHVSQSQPNHVLRSALVLGTVVHHAVHPVG